MAHFEDLFLLTKSLSKSEKRYFRLTGFLQDGGNVSLKLFDLLEANDSISDVKSKFFHQQPKANLDTSAKYLYKMVMRTLRLYEAERNIDNKLLTLASDARILFERGLITKCFCEIERGKKLAFAHEKFLHFTILSKLELQFLLALQFADIDEPALLERQSAISDALQLELNIANQSSLFELAQFRYFRQGVARSKSQLAKLNDLLLEEFQLKTTRFRSFQSDKLHLHFQSVYFLMSGNIEQSLKEFYALNELVALNKVYVDDDNFHFLYLLNGILTTLRFIKKYSEIEFFVNRLERLTTSSESAEALKSHFVFIHKTSLLVDAKRYEDAAAMVRQETIENHKAPLNVASQYLMQKMIVFFWVKDYSAALKLYGQMQLIPKEYMPSQIYSLGRLLYLLVHVELANDDHLVYSIKSLTLKLKKTSKLFQVEELTINMAKKWISAPSLLERRNTVESYAAKIGSFSENPFELQLVGLFSFENWAIKKLEEFH
jgi:hypothetical protein